MSVDFAETAGLSEKKKTLEIDFTDEIQVFDTRTIRAVRWRHRLGWGESGDYK